MAVLTGCKKDKDEAGVSIKSIAGSYIVSVYTFNDGSGDKDLLAGMKPCERDDVFEFKVDKTYAVLDAGLHCNPSQNYNSTWDLISSTKMIMGGSDFVIEKFTGKSSSNLSYQQ